MTKKYYKKKKFNNHKKIKEVFNHKKKLITLLSYKTTYLYKNKKLKKGVFLKKPTYKKILYPFFLNLKLVNEYLKKK